eukprot:9229572-Pyramimonas_sp.AAC.1
MSKTPWIDCLVGDGLGAHAFRNATAASAWPGQGQQNAEAKTRSNSNADSFASFVGDNILQWEELLAARSPGGSLFDMLAASHTDAASRRPTNGTGGAPQRGAPAHARARSLLITSSDEVAATAIGRPSKRRRTATPPPEIQIGLPQPPSSAGREG